MDVGLDSLATTQVVQELSREFGVELKPTLLFDHPTIEALAKHLTEMIIKDTATPGRSVWVMARMPLQVMRKARGGPWRVTRRWGTTMASRAQRISHPSPSAPWHWQGSRGKAVSNDDETGGVHEKVDGKGLQHPIHRLKWLTTNAGTELGLVASNGSLISHRRHHGTGK